MNIPAPPVEGEIWLNSEISDWEDLRGRISILVFWALGDEMSLARLNQVQELSVKYPDLVTIGVHTPRLGYEDELDNLQSIVKQHNLVMPVVHDPKFKTWNRYNPEGWPTTILIGDQLSVLGAQSGVDYFETLDEAVRLSMSVAKNRRSSDLAPLNTTQLSTPTVPSSAISFPTCVRVTDDYEIVFVDSQNNRIIFASLSDDLNSAHVTAIADGFDGPNSVAVSNKPGIQSQIFVSESRTGSIIRYDRTTGERHSLAEGLSRPTGLTIDRDNSLVVAETAAQQILRISKPADTVNVQLGPIANNSISESVNVVQPTSLVRTEVGLVFCDAATSSLSLLTDKGKLTTIVGEAYEWGLIDGPAHQARLQRPSDLAVMNDGTLLIADTGNNRLRRLSKRRLKTVGPAGINRPQSVCVLPSGEVLVADTGNDRIVVLDPNLQNPRSLEILGLDPPQPEQRVRPSLTKGFITKQGYDGIVGERLAVSYPAPGTGPWSVHIHSEPASLLAEPVTANRNSSVGKILVNLGQAGSGDLFITTELKRDSTIHEQVRVPLVVHQLAQASYANGENRPTSAPQ